MKIIVNNIGSKHKRCILIVMATKKTTTKKTPVKKASTARKSSPKKSTNKKSVSAVASLRNQLRLQREETEFMTFRITRQTLYWLVLGVVVIMFTLWLTKLQADIQDLYDQIDANTAAISE